MADMTPREIVDYYVGLMIIQYTGKPGASGLIAASASQLIMPQTTVQQIAFTAPPTTGTFKLSYNGVETAAINFNDSANTIQSKIRAIDGLEDVVVTGSIAAQLLTVTFTNVPPPANNLLVSANTLVDIVTSVAISITETDVTLPTAILNAFNFVAGTDIAVGAQLDVVGKYAGVVRSGFGFTQNITLDDTDFTTLIKMAIIKNSSGSSLATIQSFLHTFFPNQILVVDHKDMTLSYIVSSGIVSSDLIQMFVTQGLLPKPMAVGIDVIIYVPTVNLFSFRTYEAPAVNASPFNTYEDYQTDYPWLSYHNII